jgi:hypothetical protein
MSARPVRWRSALLLLAAVSFGIFNVAGYLQAGSLQGTGYQTAAWIYLVLLAVSLVGIIAIFVWRWRRRYTPPPVG